MKKYLVYLALTLALAGAFVVPGQVGTQQQQQQLKDSQEWFRWFNLTNAIKQQTRAIQDLQPSIYYPWIPSGYNSGGLGALFLLNRLDSERRMMDEYFRRKREIEDYYARQRMEQRQTQDYYDAFMRLSPMSRNVFWLLPTPQDRLDWLYLSPEVREERTKRIGIAIAKAVEEKFQDLKSQIEAKKAEFPNARESDVWKLLELQEEKGKPLYDVASAMKKSHEDQTAFLKSIPEKK